MPKWADYKREARERGALALELFVVQSTPAADPSALKETLPRHLAYQLEIEDAGHLVFAGPLSDEAGIATTGAGLMIYRADSIDQARAIAEADPMHKEGKRTFTLRRWLVNEGGMTISVRFAGQKATLV